jgi:hypothetical protein
MAKAQRSREEEELIGEPISLLVSKAIKTVSFIGTKPNPIVASYDVNHNRWSPHINKSFCLVSPQCLIDISPSATDTLFSVFHLTPINETTHIARLTHQLSLKEKVLNPLLIVSENKKIVALMDQSPSLKSKSINIFIENENGWELCETFHNPPQLTQRGIIMFESDPISFMSVGGVKETQSIDKTSCRLYESQPTCHITVNGNEVQMENLHIARCEPSILMHNNKVYVIGGWKTHPTNLSMSFGPIFHEVLSIETLDMNNPESTWELLSFETPFHVFGPNGAIINDNSILLMSSKGRTASLSLVDEDAKWDFLCGLTTITTLNLTEFESFL